MSKIVLSPNAPFLLICCAAFVACGLDRKRRRNRATDADAVAAPDLVEDLRNATPIRRRLRRRLRRPRPIRTKIRDSTNRPSAIRCCRRRRPPKTLRSSPRRTPIKPSSHPITKRLTRTSKAAEKSRPSRIPFLTTTPRRRNLLTLASAWSRRASSPSIKSSSGIARRSAAAGHDLRPPAQRRAD